MTITAADGSVTRLSYQQDAVEQTDPRGVKKILEDDGYGRLWRVCEVTAQAGNGACGLPVAASGFLTTYVYDVNNQLAQVQQMAQNNPAGQSRAWTYDWLSRPLTKTDPESGTTTLTYDSVSGGACGSGGSVSAGDLVYRQDAAGSAICLQYDVWHRLTAKLDTAGQGFAYSYDGSAANHSLGRLAAATGNTALIWMYDAMGRPTTVEESPAGVVGYRTSSYTYNYVGEVSSVTAPSGITMSYTYDAKARLAALAAGAQAIIASRSFSPADQVTAENLGNAGGVAQLAITESYNNMDQPWELAFAPHNGGGFTQQYLWGAGVDGSGNVNTADNDGTLRKRLDATSNGRGMSYTYDDLNRVLAASSQDNAISVNFGIDAYGNRNTQTGTLGQSFTSSAATNRVSAMTYDNAGRLLSGSSGSLQELRSLTWTPENQIATYSEGVSQVASYAYGPLGRRGVSVPTGGTPTYYFYGVNDGGHPLAEYTTSWQTDVAADGRTIATLDASGNPTYLALDALGTTRQTVDGGGSASAIARYYPYGEEQTAITSEYKWTNQQRQPNGTDHFALRTYSSDMARWLAPDPAGAAAVDPSNPQSWDRYSYVGGQPDMLADPLGLAPCPKGFH
ncbi:MAG: RHS repeat-associated core domain-containing protein, partial [Terriglobales bacterium]